MREMHVACAADERYLPYCAAMLHSLHSHHPSDVVHVHFLHGPALAKDGRQRLATLAERLGLDLKLHEIGDDRIAGLPVMERIPGIMWYRIFLPELLPEQSRVLYLDADTLVVDSLLPLWDSDLGDCVIGAVTNVLEPQHRQRPAQLGLSDSSGYFNSGVLLMNLDLMRKEDSTRQIVEHAARHGHHLLWPDQDALNVVFAGKRHPLHPRWNCMNSLFHFPYSRDVYGEVQLREAVAAPAILHFEGPGHAKPWHFENRHPFRRQYYRHMRGTGWPMPRPVGLSAIAVLRRLVPAPVRGLLRQMRHLFQTVTSGGGHKSMDAAKTPVLPERLTEDPRQNRENHR